MFTRKNAKVVGWFVLLCLLPVAYLVVDGWCSKPQPADLIVVLGNQVLPNGQPSPRLKSRLDKGLELFRAGYGKKILVSGGTGKEGFDEAAVMASYLVRQGMDSSLIIRDPLGNTTFLTAQHTRQVMAERKYGSALIVSQYYHLTRTKLAFRKAGIRQVSAAACDLYEWRDFYAVPREVVGLAYYLFR